MAEVMVYGAFTRSTTPVTTDAAALPSPCTAPTLSAPNQAKNSLFGMAIESSMLTRWIRSASVVLMSSGPTATSVPSSSVALPYGVKVMFARVPDVPGVPSTFVGSLQVVRIRTVKSLLSPGSRTTFPAGMRSLGSVPVESHARLITPALPDSVG